MSNDPSSPATSEVSLDLSMSSSLDCPLDPVSVVVVLVAHDVQQKRLLGFDQSFQLLGKLERGEEPAVGSLEDALSNLDSTEEGAKEALAGRGILLGDEQEAEN